MILSATGHRPDKLGGYNQKTTDAIFCVAYRGLQSIAPDEVIVGMALGWDMAVAEAAYLLGIPFKAYIPFVGQESKWPKPSQVLYNNLLLRCAELVICAEGEYAGWKMQHRNKCMIDDSDEVLALFNGDDTGGTHNAVVYANGQGKTIHNQWEQWIMETQYTDPRGTPRDGAMRAPDPLDPTGWKWANPGSMWYSTITMVATEYFSRGVWHPVNNEDEEQGHAESIHGAEGQAGQATEEKARAIAPTRRQARKGNG